MASWLGIMRFRGKRCGSRRQLPCFARGIRGASPSKLFSHFLVLLKRRKGFFGKSRHVRIRELRSLSKKRNCLGMIARHVLRVTGIECRIRFAAELLDHCAVLGIEFLRDTQVLALCNSGELGVSL